MLALLQLVKSDTLSIQFRLIVFIFFNFIVVIFFNFFKNYVLKNFTTRSFDNSLKPSRSLFASTLRSDANYFSYSRASFINISNCYRRSRMIFMIFDELKPTMSVESDKVLYMHSHKERLIYSSRFSHASLHFPREEYKNSKTFFLKNITFTPRCIFSTPN